MQRAGRTRLPERDAGQVQPGPGAVLGVSCVHWLSLSGRPPVPAEPPGQKWAGLRQAGAGNLAFEQWRRGRRLRPFHQVDDHRWVGIHAVKELRGLDGRQVGAGFRPHVAEELVRLRHDHSK